MKVRPVRARVALLCVLLSAVLGSCGAPLGPAIDVGTIPVEGIAFGDDMPHVHIGGDHSYPPFEFINDDGEPDGFNIELVRRIAEIMGLSVTIELTEWGEARRRLEQGEIGMLAGMYRTPAREKLHSFTVPHFVASYALFVPRSSTVLGLNDVGDGVIIVHRGDLAHDYVVENALGREIVAVDNWHEVLIRLDAGEGDVALFGMGQGTREIQRRRLRNIRMIEAPVLRRPYAMAVQRDNAQLLAILNEGLNVLKSTGEFDELYRRWFGVLDDPAWWRSRTARVVIAAAVIGIGVSLAALLWVILLRRRVGEKTAELRRALEKSEAAQRELEQANRAKSRFLANVSHELRTPLNGVMGMTDLLSRTSLAADQRRLTEMIAGASGQLYRVLSDLLDVSRAEAGSLSVARSLFRLSDLVHWLEPTLRSIDRHESVEFDFNFDGPSATVHGDSERIAQIVINLVTNAIKFTDSGSVDVAIRHRDETLEIDVRDTGCGMQPAELERIFEPFTRVDRHGANTAAGLGLGLSIVRSLVELLGGTVTVHSVPSRGSRFHVTLPLPTAFEDEPPGADASSRANAAPNGDAAAGAIAGETSEAPAPPGHSFDGLSVLVAEDEVINRLYLTQLLKNHACIVTTASNGREAADAATVQRFDLILMDLSMPGLDGLEAARLIRDWERQQDVSRQPIIALTAHAYPEHIDHCREAGMDGYVTKPYTEAHLAAEIERVISGDSAGTT